MCEGIEQKISSGSVLLMLSPVNRINVDALLHHFPKWAHVTQPLYGCDNFLNHEIYLRLGGEATDPKSKRRMRHIFSSTYT